MIQVADNFNYRGKKPNFDRDSFDTLYDMKNYSENSLDDGHISYCKETGKHYKFNSNNQSDSTTGKWVEQHEAVPADEEDITEQNGTLQLANKTYDKQSFSGLGRVYLRKNIVGDKNVLTQAMINKANTIYVIQYDYDLKEASINIPENCVLQFDGGSLSNGNITLNNTIVSQPKIDNNNVKIIGNMLNTDRDKINAIYYWIKNKNITFRHNLFYGTNGFDNNYNKLKTLGINEFQVFFSLNNSKDNNIDNLPINASSTFKYFVYNSQTKKLNYRYGDNLYTINSTIITENNQRPSLSNIDKGTMYFDTAINKPIFWDGSKWIDATGATV